MHFADQLAVGLTLGLADRVAVAALGVLADQRRDDLVAAHTDVAVDLPER